MGREWIENGDAVVNDAVANAWLDRARADLANARSECFFRDLREAGRLATEQFLATIPIPASDKRQTV
jgi:hypothetical protein